MRRPDNARSLEPGQPYQQPEEDYSWQLDPRRSGTRDDALGAIHVPNLPASQEELCPVEIRNLNALAREPGVKKTGVGSLSRPLR
jgi:hypothetical protein